MIFHRNKVVNIRKRTSTFKSSVKSIKQEKKKKKGGGINQVVNLFGGKSKKIAEGGLNNQNLSVNRCNGRVFDE